MQTLRSPSLKTVDIRPGERPTLWVLGSYRGLKDPELTITRNLIITLGSSLAASRVRLVSGRSDMLQDLSGYYRNVQLSIKPRGTPPVMIEGKLRQTDLRELFQQTIGRIPDLAIVIGGSVGHRVAEECDYAEKAGIPVLPVPLTGGSAVPARLTADKAKDLYKRLAKSDGIVDTNDLVAALLEAVERYAHAADTGVGDSFEYDVFLSHNTKDKPRVRRLAERLRQAGLRVWFNKWNVRSGNIISRKVDEGLEQSRVLLLCISPNALASGWVALERSTATHRDPSNEGRRFIPLLLADCELPDTLRRYKYIDFRDESEAAFQELVEGCAGRRLSTDKSGSGRKDETLDISSVATREAVLESHWHWIRTVGFSPDGSLGISGSQDNTVKVWSLKNGVCKFTLRGHKARVRCAVFTSDGKYILSASDDKTIRVWDASTGKEVSILEGHTEEVTSVISFLNHNLALSGSLDGTIQQWDIAANIAKTIVSDAGRISCLALASNSSFCLSSDETGVMRLWNVQNGTCGRIFRGHSQRINSIQLTDGDRLAVTGSDDRTVRIWNVRDGRCLGTLEGHTDRIHSVAVSPNGEIVASTGFEDETIRLWHLRTASCLGTLKTDDTESFMSVAFAPNGAHILAGTASPSRVYLFRVSGSLIPKLVEISKKYLNAKVVLLGEGTVGKTSLAHRLIEDKYVVRDRTHGMNVWRLDLPLLPDSTQVREALLWDLAGQEDYRLIHQLFLEETALAMLLINPQKDDPFREAGDWLKALKIAASHPAPARDAARLLIFSQIDVGGMKLGSAKIDGFRDQYGFAGWLATSAKTGENCSDKENGGQPSKLKQLIADSIPWEELPWTSTPRLLVELKKAVIAMRDERDIRLLRFAELAQRLEQALPGEKFGEPDVRTAVTLLANHGLARPLKFGDLVLLQPELLNGYAGAIIRAARAHTDEIGCVLEADIYKDTFNFTGVERLKHRPDEELLLRALVQTFLDHSLCIAEDTPKGRHMVFPSQYRREKDMPRDPDIFVSYTFSGEWQTVWTTLVVRLWYSQEFEHRELWRNAAEFASPQGYTLGLKIDNKQGEGSAKISLYFDKEVPDDLKAIFIEYVHRHLARFGCEVKRARRYVCLSCGKPVQDLDAVRHRLEAKKTFITCQECDEQVLLIDFIEQRVNSDPVARKILAMDQNATRELDTQAQEQILIGHMMAIAGEANQIFRPVSMFDHGIDGEVEFKDDDGKVSGKRIYIQLKSGNSYLRTRKSDGSEIFDVKEDRHLKYWINQPVDVYLVIRQTDEVSSQQVIRWVNVTRYLKMRNDKTSRQIVFAGERLDMEAIYKVRDEFFPRTHQTRK